VTELSAEESTTDLLSSEIDEFVDSLGAVTTTSTSGTATAQDETSTTFTASFTTTTTTPSFQVYLTSTEYAHRHSEYKPRLGLAHIRNYVGQAVMNGRVHHAFQFQGNRDRNFPPQCAVLDINDPRLPRFVIVKPSPHTKRKIYKSKKCNGGGGETDCESDNSGGETEPFAKRTYRGPFSTIDTAAPATTIVSRCDTPPALESGVLQNIDAIRFASKLMDHLMINGTILPVNWADYAL
jgi:hypothetical protein